MADVANCMESSTPRKATFGSILSDASDDILSPEVREAMDRIFPQSASQFLQGGLSFEEDSFVDIASSGVNRDQQHMMVPHSSVGSPGVAAFSSMATANASIASSGVNREQQHMMVPHFSVGSPDIAAFSSMATGNASIASSGVNRDQQHMKVPFSSVGSPGIAAFSSMATANASIASSGVNRDQQHMTIPFSSVGSPDIAAFSSMATANASIASSGVNRDQQHMKVPFSSVGSPDIAAFSSMATANASIASSGVNRDQQHMMVPHSSVGSPGIAAFSFMATANASIASSGVNRDQQHMMVPHSSVGSPGIAAFSSMTTGNASIASSGVNRDQQHMMVPHSSVGSPAIAAFSSMATANASIASSGVNRDQQHMMVPHSSVGSPGIAAFSSMATGNASIASSGVNRDQQHMMVPHSSLGSPGIAAFSSMATAKASIASSGVNRDQQHMMVPHSSVGSPGIAAFSSMATAKASFEPTVAVSAGAENSFFGQILPVTAAPSVVTADSQVLTNSKVTATHATTCHTREAMVESDKKPKELLKNNSSKNRISNSDFEILTSCDAIVSDCERVSGSASRSSADIVSDNCNSGNGSDSDDMRRPFASVTKEKKKKKSKKVVIEAPKPAKSVTYLSEHNVNSGDEFKISSKSWNTYNNSAIVTAPSDSRVMLENNLTAEINMQSDLLSTRDLSGESNQVCNHSNYNGYSLHMCPVKDLYKDSVTANEDISNTSNSSTKENVLGKKWLPHQKLPKVKRDHFHIVRHVNKIKNTFPPCCVVLRKIHTRRVYNVSSLNTVDNVLPLAVRVRCLKQLCDKGYLVCKKNRKVRLAEKLGYVFFEEALLPNGSEDEFEQPQRRSLRKRSKNISYVEPCEDDIVEEFSSRRSSARLKDGSVKCKDGSVKCKNGSVSKLGNESMEKQVSHVSDVRPEAEGSDNNKRYHEHTPYIENNNHVVCSKEQYSYPPPNMNSASMYNPSSAHMKIGEVSQHMYSPLNSANASTAPFLSYLSGLSRETVPAAFPPQMSPISFFPPLPMSISGGLSTHSYIERAPFSYPVSSMGQDTQRFCLMKMNGKDVYMQLLPSGGGGLGASMPVALPAGKAMSIPPGPSMFSQPLPQVNSVSFNTQAMFRPPVPVSAAHGNMMSSASAQMSSMYGLPLLNRPVQTNCHSIPLTSLPLTSSSHLASHLNMAVVNPISHTSYTTPSSTSCLSSFVTVAATTRTSAFITPASSSTNAVHVPIASMSVPYISSVQNTSMPSPSSHCRVPNIPNFQPRLPTMPNHGPERFANLSHLSSQSRLPNMPNHIIERFTGISSPISQSRMPNLPSPISQSRSSIPSPVSQSRMPNLPSPVSQSRSNMPSPVSQSRSNMPSPMSQSRIQHIPSPISQSRASIIPNQSPHPISNHISSNVTNLPSPTQHQQFSNQPVSACPIRTVAPGFSATFASGCLAQLQSSAISSPVTSKQSADNVVFPQHKRYSDQELTNEHAKRAKRRKLEQKYPLPPGVVIKTERLDSPSESSSMNNAPQSSLSQNSQSTLVARHCAQSTEISNPSPPTSVSVQNIRNSSGMQNTAAYLGGRYPGLIAASLGLVRASPSVTSSTDFSNLVLGTSSAGSFTSSLAASTAATARNIDAVYTNSTSLNKSGGSQSYSTVSQITSAYPTITQQNLMDHTATGSHHVINSIVPVSATTVIQQTPHIISSCEPSSVSSLNTAVRPPPSPAHRPPSASSLDTAVRPPPSPAHRPPSASSLDTAVMPPPSPAHRPPSAKSSMAPAATECIRSHSLQQYPTTLSPKAAALNSFQNSLKELEMFVQAQVSCGLRTERLDKLQALLQKKQLQYKELQKFLEASVAPESENRRNGSQGHGINIDLGEQRGGSESEPFVID